MPLKRLLSRNRCLSYHRSAAVQWMVITNSRLNLNSTPHSRLRVLPFTNSKPCHVSNNHSSRPPRYFHRPSGINLNTKYRMKMTSTTMIIMLWVLMKHSIICSKSLTMRNKVYKCWKKSRKSYGPSMTRKASLT